MKKFPFITLLILVFQTTVLFSQVENLRIEYGVKQNIKFDSIQTDSKKTRLNALIQEKIKTLNYELIYCNQKSQFSQIESLQKNQLHEGLYRMAKTITRMNKEIFHDLLEKSVIEKSEFEGETYFVVKNFRFHWKISDEYSEIASYSCRKATSVFSYKGRNGETQYIPVTAWFTDEIPIPIGPKNFSGLPGLVLKVIEGNGVQTVFAKKIEINLKKNPKIKFPEKQQFTTEKAYDSIANAAYNTFIDMKGQ